MSSRADHLRQAFDTSFAAAAAPARAHHVRFLGVRLADRAYALPLAEIHGVVAARSILPLASGLPELLGLSGLRGTLLPVYSLAALLEGEPDAEPPRWLALWGDVERVAFAFARLDGYLELPGADVRPAVQRHVSAVVSGPRSVISVPSLIATIKERIGER